MGNDDYKDLFAVLDTRYVQKDECVKDHNGIVETQNEMRIDIATIKTQMKLVIGILSAVGAAILTLVAKEMWH